MITNVKIRDDDQEGRKALVLGYYPASDEYIVSIIPNSDLSEADEFSSGTNGAVSGTGSTPYRRRARNGSLISRTSLVPAERSSNADGFLVLSRSHVLPSTSSKFYPVLTTLMIRADEAAFHAKQLLQSQPAQAVLTKAGQLWESQQHKLSSVIGTNEPDPLGTISSKAAGQLQSGLESLTATIESSAPTADQAAREVLSMMKNEELTVLFVKGKERLEQLIQKQIPEATQQALSKTGISINLESRQTVFAETTEMSRKAALAALQSVLEQTELDWQELERTRDQVASSFASAFDTLAAAAKSDPVLQNVLSEVSEKSVAWQEATGKLLNTRAVGLFLDGATRIQARAAALLGKPQVDWAGEVSSKLTKAFTEGDVALAKLKGLELGESIKDRLVDAIEVRSESVGGLDGIIAGAVSVLHDAQAKYGPEVEVSAKGIQETLSTLQGQASRSASETHETLLSMLSSRSQYRDPVLMHLEQVLCDLDSHFGEDLSATDIARIARGEGGTAKLFDPIAKRAMRQIQSQLDVAESQISDVTALEVLRRVRKIVSGEMSVSSVVDELVNVLDDENVVAAGETLVLQSEKVLDAIEGVSGSGSILDVLQIAEKAGITKDTVMKELEKLDVNELLDTAGSAVTDHKARIQLLSKATDVALDFILRVIPSMPVKPLEGVKDGLLYNISNLSLEGFRVRKEDIMIQLAGMRATKSTNAADGLPELSDVTDFEQAETAVNATELLIVDVRRISAIFQDAEWNFEQTYLPYLKGEGKANVNMSDASIRLQFELRRLRRRNKDGTVGDWTPVLCLHDRHCTIENVHLSIPGDGRLAWIVNKLASIFKGALRDYVVKTILLILTNRSGWMLQRLNSTLEPYWHLILQTANLRMVSTILASGSQSILFAASHLSPFRTTSQKQTKMMWLRRRLRQNPA
jgi:hypothetical protein